MSCLLLAALLPTLATGDAVPKDAIELSVHKIEMKINEASATMSPWIDANGWRILRNPSAFYYYDVPSSAAALAAAEAFVYRVNASVHTDANGSVSFNRMLEFLRGLPDQNLPALANVGVLDDGSDLTGELMNLLGRRNILYKIVSAPDPSLSLNVRIGSPEYPEADAADSYALAQRIRSRIGDAKRLFRIYGGETTLARLEGDGARMRVHLLNYSGRRANGLRVRVLGAYSTQKMFGFEQPAAELEDVLVDGDATEFTVRNLTVYAVIDLSR